MSWSEQEKNLKNKLLNYEEEVNNDALWASLSQRHETRKRSLLLPIIFAALAGMFLTAMVSCVIIKEKNENIISLNTQLNKSKSDYLKCANQNSKMSEDLIAINRKQAIHELQNEGVKNHTELNNNILKKSYPSGANKGITEKSDDTNVHSQKEIKSVDNSVFANVSKESTTALLSVLPSTSVQSTLPVKKVKLIALDKKKNIINKLHSIYISGHTGIPLVVDESVLAEQKTSKAYTPVLAYKFGIGMERKITDRFSLRGELFYSSFTNKLPYHKTIKEQINLNDTSQITIDELGNKLYEIDEINGTKTTTVKGKAYNTSQTIAANILLTYNLIPKLNTRFGLGYHVWQNHRGINYESLKKFKNSDKDFRFNTNYTVGFSYQLYKNAYLDAMCIYSQSQYFSSELLYQRSSFTPFIGISYWFK